MKSILILLNVLAIICTSFWIYFQFTWEPIVVMITLVASLLGLNYSSIKRKITQSGNKSVYIEKNSGEIKIK